MQPKTGWATVGRDAFSVITRYVRDGRTLVWLSRACKHTHRLVTGDARARSLIERHTIVVDDDAELARAISLHASAAVIRMTEGDKLLATILWYKHAFNLCSWERLRKGARHTHPNARVPWVSFEKIGVAFISGFRAIESMIRHSIHHLEDFDFVADNEGNLSIITNHYGPTPIDVDSFCWLRDFFPGTFDWRIIEFPVSDYHAQQARGKRFHRGNCLQLMFRAHPDITFANGAIFKTLGAAVMPDLTFYKRKTKRNGLHGCRAETLPPTPELVLLQHAEWLWRK